MKKKTLQKISRLFASLVLVGAMSLGAVAPVNAATNANGGVEWTDVENPEAAITVEYKMGKDVVTPESNVSFTFTKVDRPVGVAESVQPALFVDNITFAAGEDEVLDTSVSNIKVLRQQSGNFLKNFVAHVNDAGMTTGLYRYTVKATSSAEKAKQNDKFTASLAEYDITVYVAQKSNGDLYVKGLGVWTKVSDAGSTLQNKTKVDATPGTTENGLKGNFSGLVFVNEYTAKAGSVDPTDPSTPDPNDPDSYAFKVSNTVEKATATATGHFKYTMTLTKPEGVGADENTYEYYVDGEKKTGTYGKEVSFELDAGKSMLVKSCYAGSTVSVTEQGVANWTPSATPTFNNVTGSVVPGQMGKNLTVADKTIGQKENKVEYKNVFKDIAVTGIIVNNFPFVMMIVMAMAAFVAIVAVKSRRRMNER